MRADRRAAGPGREAREADREVVEAPAAADGEGVGVDGRQGLDEADGTEGTARARWTAFDLYLFLKKNMHCVRTEERAQKRLSRGGKSYQDVEGVQKLAPADRVPERGGMVLWDEIILRLLQLQVRGAAPRDAAGHALDRRCVPVAAGGERHRDRKVVLAVEEGQRLAADLLADAGQGGLGEADYGAVVLVVWVGDQDESVDLVADLGRETQEGQLGALLVSKDVRFG